MSTGYLQLFSRSARDGIPVDAVTATITSATGTVITVVTDEGGYSDPIALPAPDKAFSLDENNRTVLPYAVYTVSAEKTGWENFIVENIQVFAEENALMYLEMEPQNQESVVRAAPEMFDVPVHSLFKGDGGSGPEPKVFCDSSEFVLREVIIPTNVIVHLGRPTSSAQNVTVSFRDYIKNVASSEIYPTWPEESLKANIYAQISLALNRVFTEWYPSKGYPFTITNSTSYDQYFVYGRNIFDSVSKVVDDIFNTYIRKSGTVEPFYAEYCDGKIVPNCPGMKQWGTKTLADQGKTALQILQYYYGNSIELITTNNIQAIPSSYPGTPLRLGSTGTDVSIMQRQLNRISKNYPALGTLQVNGTFDSATQSSVKNFQKQFSLTQDGVVGKSTWYKISYIYVAVKKLAELTSEGEKPTGLPSTGTYPGTALKQGDTGANVKRVQFYLSVLSEFNSSIPTVSIDGIFGPATTAAVKAFQATVPTTQDGVVGPVTWAALYNEFMSTESDITPPGTDWIGQYPGTPLRVGSTGTEVQLAQFFLTVLSSSYPDIPAISPDGIYGSATANAVIKFQNRFSLAADGVIGKATWDKLYEVYADLVNGVLDPNETPGVYPGAPLTVGSTGQKVKEVQFYLFLLSAYYSSIPRIAYDGVFGVATQNAVIAYQKLANLTQDGIVGPATWQSIYISVIRLRTIDGPIVTYTISDTPSYTLKEGMSGDVVSFVQQMLDLADDYYDSIPETDNSGYYGPDTTLAVKAFQQLFALPITGEVDTETWNTMVQVYKELLVASGGELSVAAGSYPGYVLGYGSAGPAVLELQYYIESIAERYCAIDFLDEDGWFGPQTEQVVIDFQQAFGLPVTGVVDEATWEVIYGYYLQITGRAVSKLKIFVYDQYENKFYIFYRDLTDPMPYSTGRTLLVREFRGSSKSNTLWTTTRAMESWNETRETYGSGIPVGYAFKRIWEGGHGTTSQHYAGVAFDVGQTLTAAQRRRIWNVAYDLGVWGYVEPLSMTPTWVHFDRRYGTPACGGTSGYPTVRNGSRSTYVLILQDALNALGYSTKTLDGIFGNNTLTALKAFQRDNGLTADGICGCASWRKIANAAVGIGRTPTVID
ncbi:peptidoglycan-binding protein [Pygmaiobacter massiliensis]|uniref:peptidoglycan-binding protein n=1 Tax=Pygmaiobacter massiliensis TaxID=1917873 RepID=UPI001FA8A79B|nr:peptidoglycan-binding protein [Pygmaiobacter massiliensis]